ncbi:MAG: pentapeptide repeat-containing protein [Lachnospiraceae bacterium]|nr:pentapeptide repeat-containing protein [Lachnospiraceae bacterium]
MLLRTLMKKLWQVIHRKIKNIRLQKKYHILVEIVMLAIFIVLVSLAVKAFCTHFSVHKYDSESWGNVWPVLVSTVIVVFSTLITSYVFLKDTLDRVAEEKPYYSEIIKTYRKEKVARLMWFSVMFVGVSCYLMMSQTRTTENEMPFFIYIGIVFVIVLLAFALRFLYNCINVDRSLNQCTNNILNDYENRMKSEWRNLETSCHRFVNNYVRIRDESLIKFLEVIDDENEKQNGTETIDDNKFIVKFSEWEKFILFFTDHMNDFHSKRNVDQRISVAEGYIENLNLIRELEEKDADTNGWKSASYLSILRYENQLLKSDNTTCRKAILDIQEFLNLYRLLSKYRDALQVKQDIYFQGNKGYSDFTEHARSKEAEEAILSMLFLLRFYSSVRFMGVMSKIEISYPAAKLNSVDFYNIRFENSSFRVSRFEDTVFARSKIVGSNLALSKFIDCNFYNAYFSDCSLANTLFEDCLMTEMTLLNVDATGSELNRSDLKNSTFEDAFLVNVEFHDCNLDHVNFINCKLDHILFCNVTGKNLFRCSFAGSIVKNWQLDPQIKEWGLNLPELHRRCKKNDFITSVIGTGDTGTKHGEKAEPWDMFESAEANESGHYNLSYASFAGSMAEEIQFQEVILDASDFSQANLQKSKWNCIRMKGCMMTEVNLTEAELVFLNMESCVLTDAILYSAGLELVNLKDSDLTNCHASKSRWTDCMLDRSEMREIDLTKAEFKNSSFRDTILADAELTQAVFSNVIFDNCNGQGILCAYSGFDHCRFFNAYMPKSNFNYTVFRDCSMELASMVGCMIEEAEFENCDLKNCNFRNCTFIRVKFKNNSHFSKEIFEGCTFVECVFEGTDEKWHHVFKHRPKHYNVIDRK